MVNLYQSGLTQKEVADALGTTPKVIQKRLKQLGVKCRVAKKRNQFGAANTGWRGDQASYSSLHARVERKRGKPKKCEVCGSENESTIYDWANITGNYADLDDYVRMCRACHRKFDDHRRGHGPGKRLDVTVDDVRALLEKGYSVSAIARELRTCGPTVMSRIEELNKSSRKEVTSC